MKKEQQGHRNQDFYIRWDQTHLLHWQTDSLPLSHQGNNNYYGNLIRFQDL